MVALRLPAIRDAAISRRTQRRCRRVPIGPEGNKAADLGVRHETERSGFWITIIWSAHDRHALNDRPKDAPAMRPTHMPHDGLLEEVAGWRKGLRAFAPQEAAIAQERKWFGARDAHRRGLSRPGLMTSAAGAPVCHGLMTVAKSSSPDMPTFER